MKIGYMVGIMIGMLFLLGCASKTEEYAELSFQELCAQTGGMWMKMQPTQNFAPTGEPACMGCMQQQGDHICDKEQYIQSLG